MARTSNKDKAIAYAAERGIILTVEDRDNFDGDYAVEVWSHDSHLSEQNSYCHTYFARGNTEPRAWADALAYMEQLTDCPADCSCRYLDQEQDQEQDQDQDQDQDLSNEAEVWVCECCALWLNGDHSSCRDYFNHTHPNCDPAIICLTDEMFTVGYFHTNCNGCGMIQRTGATMYGAIADCSCRDQDQEQADASEYVEWLAKSRQLMRDCVTHGVIGIDGLCALLEVGTISYRQFKELETLATQNGRNEL